MSEAIGIRLDKDFLKKIEKYMQGKITMSEAAHRAEITIFDMEQYLVEQGYKSSYSIEDLKREMRMIG